MKSIGFIGVYTPALRWDNLPETHGQSPPNHPTLISADLCDSGFHRSYGYQLVLLPFVFSAKGAP